jgi:hypothetical protein
MVQKTFCDFCEKEMNYGRKIIITEDIRETRPTDYSYVMTTGDMTRESWDICDQCTTSLIYSPISQMTGIASPIPLPETITFHYKKWKE